jgi:hypothetical protein
LFLTHAISGDVSSAADAGPPRATAELTKAGGSASIGAEPRSAAT